MPVLNWIGKDAVVKHHKEVPFRLIEPDDDLSCGEESGNLIVEGDNLLALKALLPRYAGKVKCIYIDPPYNTGNEGWAYNDNVKSPEIKKWLNEVVGKEGETLDRHDRWLCMMYPRLVLLKQFLREDGAIFVSIDDNEVASLRLLMDEIFGSGNFISQFVWEKRKNRENRKVISMKHDHIICYGRNAYVSVATFKPLPMDKQALLRYKNPDDDPRGPWKSDPAHAQAGHGTQSQFYVLTAPNGKLHALPGGRCWVYTEDVMNEKIKDKRIWFGVHGNNVPRIKTFLHDKERGLTPESILYANSVSTNEEAKNFLKQLFGGEVPFETPKPMELIRHLLSISTNPGDLVLDSFAGSGTTGHAVLDLNKTDGNRKFILVQMPFESEDQRVADLNVTRDATAERIRRVAEGYTNAKGEQVAGLGGGFQYCRLSEEPLFLADGSIRKTVTFRELAEFVWFMESGSGMQKPARSKGIDATEEKNALTSCVLPHQEGTESQSAFIGTHNGKAVFLLYNGILKDRSDVGGNVLNSRTLEYIDSLLPEHDGERIIYGARTRFDKKKLASLGITFHQLPYDLATKTWF